MHYKNLKKIIGVDIRQPIISKCENHTAQSDISYKILKCINTRLNNYGFFSGKIKTL